MNWSADDWDFGTTEQYPAIKYNATECETTSPSSRCGSVLPYQGSLLKSFTLVGNAGLARPFDFATFNYAIAVGADQENLQFTASAFNPQAKIVISKDGIEVGEFTSGMPISPIALNRQDNTIVEIVVKEVVKEKADRSSYRYRFIVSHLDARVDLAAIDADADGLIDVGTAKQLSAMRYSPNGNFYRESAEGIKVYCRIGCVGFELINDIDLAGMNWQPIGTASTPSNAHFNGNGYAISNLIINRSDSHDQGLFAYVGINATIENIRLLNFNINGNTRVAALAASNYGTINNSHSSNIRIHANGPTGGLVSINEGTINNSSNINGSLFSANSCGGLVGTNSGVIVNSRAMGIIINAIGNVSNIGGLVGANQGRYFRQFCNRWQCNSSGCLS